MLSRLADYLTILMNYLIKHSDSFRFSLVAEEVENGGDSVEGSPQRLSL
jgi:hypothetical protein